MVTAAMTWRSGDRQPALGGVTTAQTGKPSGIPLVRLKTCRYQETTTATGGVTKRFTAQAQGIGLYLKAPTEHSLAFDGELQAIFRFPEIMTGTDEKTLQYGDRQQELGGF
jgi:hypothetical protein